MVVFFKQSEKESWIVTKNTSSMNGGRGEFQAIIGDRTCRFPIECQNHGHGIQLAREKLTKLHMKHGVRKVQRASFTYAGDETRL